MMIGHLLLIFQSTLFSTMTTYGDMSSLEILFAEQLQINHINMEDEQKSITSTSESDDDARSSDDENSLGACRYLKYRVKSGGKMVDEYVIRKVVDEFVQALDFKDPKVLIKEVIDLIPTSAVFQQFIDFCNDEFMVSEDTNIFNKGGQLWEKISELSKAGKIGVGKSEAHEAIKNLCAGHLSDEDIVDNVATLILYYCCPFVRFRRHIFEPEQNYFPKEEMDRMFKFQELDNIDGWNLIKIEFCDADCRCDYILKKYSSVLFTQELRATLVLEHVMEVLTKNDLL